MNSPSVPQNPKSCNTRQPVPCNLQLFDVQAARRYLFGVETLIREARTARDSRVLVAALQILRQQGQTVDALLPAESCQ